MFLEQHVGKEIALVLKPEWHQEPNLCRGIANPADKVILEETLAGVDGFGVWVERTDTEHVFGEGSTLHILIPWFQIIQVGVVVEGRIGDKNTQLLIRGQKPVGFAQRKP